MSAISSYKQQFSDASKHLKNDRAQLLKLEQKMAVLQAKKEQVEQRIVKDMENKREKGLLYYSEQKRTELLDKVENFPYSKQAIQRLRSIDRASWDTDHIDSDTIEDFEAIEKYVNDNTPAWEQWPVAKLGKWFNNDGQE